MRQRNGTATLSGTPAAGTGGTYPLTFTAVNGVGSPATQSFTLTVAAPATARPTVTGLVPTSGPAAGGTPVTITGTNLSGATGVLFGTAAASFTWSTTTRSRPRARRAPPVVPR